MTMYGLYQPYKVNRSLTKEDKNNQFKQGRYKKVKYFNCDTSVIRMNSTYLETVDKYYKRKGQDNAWWLLASIMIVSVITIGLFRAIQLISTQGLTPLIRIAPFCLVMLGIVFLQGDLYLRNGLNGHIIRFASTVRMARCMSFEPMEQC